MARKLSPNQGGAPWTYLTNHAHVLILLARDASSTMREAADAVGITERAVQRIVSELEDARVLEHSRIGRRNVYSVNASLTLRHPIESHCTVADLLSLINAPLRKTPAEEHQQPASPDKSVARPGRTPPAKPTRRRPAKRK